jgi:hypothetical protein
MVFKIFVDAIIEQQIAKENFIDHISFVAESSAFLIQSFLMRN